MKLWIDNTNLMPEGYHCCHTVNETRAAITFVNRLKEIFPDSSSFTIELLDIGSNGYGRNRYINILEWLEKQDWNYPIHLHGEDSVENDNMREIIRKNGWKEV